jgi:hypothetical protein
MTRAARATAPALPKLPPALVNLHRLTNRTTVGSWERYREHRRRVTDLALSAGGETLALLGAGNCNDVDLALLTGRYREVHLVDVDREALRGAKARQPDDVASSLVLHAPVDLSGFLDRLPVFRTRNATALELGGLLEAGCERVLSAVPAKFDTIVSTCLLSQLMHGCYCGLGQGHPQLHLLGSAAAVVHLRSLVQLLSPGGTAILLTDTVSSETYPLDEESTAKDGAVLVEYLDESGKAISGTELSMLRNVVTEDPVVAPLLASSRVIPPWLWAIRERMTLLVYGLSLTRRIERPPA